VSRAIAAGLAALALGGCGYQDDNHAAARVVAQSFLDAYAKHDAAAVCRVLAPDLLATVAAEAGGSCEGYVQRTFKQGPGRLRAGDVVGDEHRVKVRVANVPGRFLGVLRYGSTWRVAEGWQLTEL
jgi:hypothetical protein